MYSDETTENKIETPSTPLEKRVAAAIAGIEKNRQPLLDAGVTEQVIEAAKVNSEKRARLEYEQEQAEDPLIRLEGIIQEEAKTPDDQAIAAYGIKGMEDLRVWLKNKLADPKTEPQFSTDATLLSYTNIPEARNNRLAVPSPEFQERVLRRLGVLGDDEGLNFLERHPNCAKSVVPYYEKMATDLPTNITGCKAIVYIGGQQPGIRLRMDAPTTQKIAKFEPSIHPTLT